MVCRVEVEQVTKSEEQTKKNDLVSEIEGWNTAEGGGAVKGPLVNVVCGWGQPVVW